MKSRIKTGELPYPKLMMHYNTDVVLFLEEGGGVLMHSNVDGKKLGSVITKARMTDYRDFSKKLEISND